jgi:hypothetical protein
MKAIVRKEVHLSVAIVRRLEKEAKKQKTKVKLLMEDAIKEKYGEDKQVSTN